MPTDLLLTTLRSINDNLKLAKGHWKAHRIIHRMCCFYVFKIIKFCVFITSGFTLKKTKNNMKKKKYNTILLHNTAQVRSRKNIDQIRETLFCSCSRTLQRKWLYSIES